VLSGTAPRRRLGEGVESAATLFAAEASVALERVERQARERERSAGELDEVIVRGLVLAKQALQRADEEQALEAVDDTLGRARALVRDQLRAVSAARGGADAGEAPVAAPPPAAR
jgi:hypothetical protein